MHWLGALSGEQQSLLEEHAPVGGAQQAGLTMSGTDVRTIRPQPPAAHWAGEAQGLPLASGTGVHTSASHSSPAAQSPLSAHGFPAVPAEHARVFRQIPLLQSQSVKQVVPLPPGAHLPALHTPEAQFSPEMQSESLPPSLQTPAMQMLSPSPHDVV
jgi:hypothetical protein